MQYDALSKLDAIDTKMRDLKEQMAELRGVSGELHRELARRRDPVAMIADKITVRRYSGVNIEDDGVVSTHVDLDATGPYFRAVAKAVHNPIPVYKAELRTWGAMVYWREERAKAPERFAQMTEEQLAVSAQMVNELNAVYNKYWIMLHPDVELVDLYGRHIIREINYPEAHHE